MAAGSCIGIANAAPAGGSVTGVVTDSVTHSPLTPVEITLSSPVAQATTTTDKQGAYAFTRLAPGTYRLLFHQAAYDDLAQTVVITGNRTVTIDPALAPVPSIIGGAGTGVTTPASALDKTNSVGSRLDLTARETPATVQVLTQNELQARNLVTADQAFNGFTGVIAGDIPSAPTSISMRGFTSASVAILQDGVRVTTSTIVGRNVDTWNFESIDLIKGPVSVLYGEGGVAGAINEVTKKASLDGSFENGLATFGSFDSSRLGVGVNHDLSSKVAVRADFSYDYSNSPLEINANLTQMAGTTTSVLYQPNQRLSLLVGYDYYNDRTMATYEGTPIIPRALARDPTNLVAANSGYVLDSSLRFTNYNTNGSFTNSGNSIFSGHAAYVLSPSWQVTGDSTFYDANRYYGYSDPTYDVKTQLFDRNARRIIHMQHFEDDRLTFAYDGHPKGFVRNRFSLGFDYNHTNFIDPREIGTAPSVSIFNPVPGTFPANVLANFPGAGNDVIYESYLQNPALFAEDAVNVGQKLLLVGGVRDEGIYVNRTIVDLNGFPTSNFSPAFRPFSYRGGFVYSLSPAVQVYGDYSTAVVPVSSILILPLSSATFQLQTGKSLEFGTKASFARSLALTAAVYKIYENNVLTQDPTNPNLTDQGGTQSSRGAELTLEGTINPEVAVNVGLAYTDAHYDTLFAGSLNESGNRPPTVPRTVETVSTFYTPHGSNLTIGLFANAAAGFNNDSANTIYVAGHATYDTSLRYKFKNVAMTVRANNVTNQLYGQYTGNLTTLVLLGAPRNYEFTLSTVRF